MIGGLLFILVAGVIAVLAYDQKLEPHDDLMPVRISVPDASKNGYFLLKERWEKVPEGTKEERDQLRDMVNGKTPWDENFVAKRRTGRESAFPDAIAALALPEFLTPPVLTADDPNLSGNAWVIKPYMHLAMEAIASARSGDSATAVAMLRAMHALASQHIKGSGNLLSLLIGTSLLAVSANVTCEILDSNNLQPGDAAVMADIWKGDPPAKESWRYAMQSEAAFARDVIERADMGIASGGYEKPKWNGLFLKRNVTLNKSYARLRNTVAVAFVTYSTAEAAQSAGWGRRTDHRSKLVKNLDANYSGNKYLEEGEFSASSFLPRLTGAILFVPRALRVRIALYRWRIIHPELWPARLEELVPEFLREVPSDPFSGKSIRWDPESQIISSDGSDWKATPPVFDKTKHGWFTDDPESPGLRLKRPLPQPPRPSSRRAKPTKPGSAPTTSTGTPATSK